MIGTGKKRFSYVFVGDNSNVDYGYTQPDKKEYPGRFEPPPSSEGLSADTYLQHPEWTQEQKDSVYNTAVLPSRLARPEKGKVQMPENIPMARTYSSDLEKNALSNIAQASREGNFTQPYIQATPPNGIRSREADPITQAVIRTLSEPVMKLKEGGENLARGKILEGGTDVLTGAMHGAFLPFTVPFGAGTEALKQTGNVGKEVAGGLERTMNIPFDAIRGGSDLVNKGLQELGIDPQKISESVGISPELDQKINNLLIEIGGIAAIKGLHTGAGKINESMQPVPKLFRDRFKQPTEVQNAEEIRGETQTGSSPEGINRQAGERLRVRNTEENRVEAVNTKEAPVQSSKEKIAEPITPEQKTILPEAEKQTADLPSLEETTKAAEKIPLKSPQISPEIPLETKGNESAINRMVAEGKMPEDISKALNVPVEEVKKIAQPIEKIEQLPKGKRKARELTKEEFFGNPRIYSPSKEQLNETPKKVYDKTLKEPLQSFMGKYQIRKGSNQYVVYDGDKKIATYSSGDNLVVDKKYRNQGIGEELVYQYKTEVDPFPQSVSRTKEVQKIYERVYNRIKKSSEQPPAIEKQSIEKKISDKQGNKLLGKIFTNLQNDPQKQISAVDDIYNLLSDNNKTIADRIKNIAEQKLNPRGTGSKESQIETEKLNKEFSDQVSKQRENLDLSQEELIADKLADGEKLTPEEQKYYEENQYAPEGYKYDNEGNLYKVGKIAEKPRALDKPLWDAQYKDLKSRIPKDFHKKVVEKAAELGNIGEGIKDYPDLAEKYKVPEIKTVEKEKGAGVPSEEQKPQTPEGKEELLQKFYKDTLEKAAGVKYTSDEIKSLVQIKPQSKTFKKRSDLLTKANNIAFEGLIKSFAKKGLVKEYFKRVKRINDDSIAEGMLPVVLEHNGKHWTDSMGLLYLNDDGYINWDKTFDIIDKYSPKKITSLSSESSRTPKEGVQTSNTTTRKFKVVAKEQAFAGKSRIPTSLEPKKEPIKSSDIISNVEKDLGIPIRVGHIRGKPSGIFKVQPEVIRTKEANNLATMSHEIAHYIDKKVLGGDKNAKRFNQWKDELGKIDYNPKLKRPSEGFAEYLRHYLTMDDAVEVAPKFHSYFEKDFLPNNPKFAGIIKKTKDQITQWREQGALSRVISQIDFTGNKPESKFRDRFENVKIKAQTAITDQLAPLRYAVDQIVKDAGAEKLRPSEDPYQIALSVQKTAAAKAREFVENGAFDFRLNKVGKSLKNIVKPISKDAQNAIAYAYAKHAKSLIERDINPGISLEDANYILKNFNKPEYEQFSKDFTEWSNYLLDYLVDAGGLSKDGANRMREVNPFYIPLKRAFVDQENISAPKGRGMVDLPTPIKRIKGSGREVINPLESMIAQTEQIIAIADKARVARALADLSDKFEGTGKWIEKVPAPMEAKMTELENLKKQIESVGGDLSNADMDAMITMFSQGKGYFGKDNIVSIYRGGKREYFQLHPMLYSAMKGLDKITLPWFIDYTFGKATRTVRLGATGIRAGFALITNPIRDAQTFMLQSEKTGVRPDKIAKALFEEFRGKSEYAREFRRAGGEMSQPLGLDRRMLQNTVQEILADDVQSKALNMVKHPIEALRRVLSFPEAGTRLAEFESVMNKYKPKFEKAKADGNLVELKKLQEDATIEASNAASEVTVNFKRMGSYSAILNQIIPFFNPAIQGVSRLGRTVYEHPVQSGLRATAMMTAPTLALWWLNKDEDWYKNLPDWQKYAFWNFKIGDNIVRLPKPFEWGYLFGAIPEGVANSIYQKNPKYYKDATKETVSAMLPDVVPALVKPAVESYFNWDIFRDRPIVSESQKGLLPEQQFTPYTSGVAKEAGKILNVSPSKIDHLLSGYTGGLARDILDTFPKEYKEPADIPVVGRLFTRQSMTGFNGKIVQDFYNALQRSESVYRTLNNARKFQRTVEVTDEDKKYLAYRKQLRGVANNLKTLRERQRQLSNMNLDPEIKKQINKSIEETAGKLAERALNLIEK